jgi:hypothetical protein
MNKINFEERDAFVKYVNECQLKVPEEVARLFLEYTIAIWDYKLVGLIYKFYDDDCVIYREGGKEIRGLDATFEGTLSFMAACPDLKFVFLDIFAQGNEKNGYSFGQALYYDGTNTGYSSYGAPTGKKLTNDIPCIGLCECLVKKVNGRWKIVEEWLVRGGKAIEKTFTPDVLEPTKTTEDVLPETEQIMED